MRKLGKEEIFDSEKVEEEEGEEERKLLWMDDLCWVSIYKGD